MSDTLSLDVRGVLSWLRQESLSLSTIADAARLEYAASLSPGGSDGQVNLLWYDQIVLAAAAQQDLTLSSLSSTIFGSAVAASFAAVKALLVVNAATAAGDDLLLGGAGSAGHAWSAPFNGDADAVLVVPADSAALLINKHAGWAVTSGSADVLRLKNNGSDSTTVKIVLAGVSA